MRHQTRQRPKRQESSRRTKENVAANCLLLACMLCPRLKALHAAECDTAMQQFVQCVLPPDRKRKTREKEARGGKVDWKVCWQIRHEGRHLHAGLDAVALAFSGALLRTLCPLRYKSDSMFTAKERTDGGAIVHSRHTVRPVYSIEFWFAARNLQTASRIKPSATDLAELWHLTDRDWN